MKGFLFVIGFLYSCALNAQVDLAFYQAHARVGSSSSPYYSAGLEYFTIPEKQIAPIRFSAQLSNNTGNVATNSYLAVEVFEDGVLDVILYSDSMDICGYCVDSLFVTLPYLPDSGTNYVFNYFLYSDQPEANLTDNDYTRELVIDHNAWGTYRRDIGQYTTYIADNPVYPGDPAEFGNVFELFAADNICGASVYISPAASNVGNIIYSSIYLLDTASGEFWFEDYSNDYEVTEDDLGEYVTLYFYNAQVDSGDIVSVMAGHYGSTMMTQFGQSQQAPFGTVIGFCSGSVFVPGNYRTLMVYPIFYENDDCWDGIKENQVTDFIFFPIAPNPATDKTTIHYKLEQNSMIQFCLRDMQGKIIRRTDAGEQNYGEYYFDVELSNVEPGIYFISIQTEHGVQTQKLVKR